MIVRENGAFRAKWLLCLREMIASFVRYSRFACAVQLFRLCDIAALLAQNILLAAAFVLILWDVFFVFVTS